MSPSGNPRCCRASTAGAMPGRIARRSRGSAVIDSAVEMMITSWTASDDRQTAERPGLREPRSQSGQRVEQCRARRCCRQPSPVKQTELRDHDHSSPGLRATGRWWVAAVAPQNRLPDNRSPRERQKAPFTAVAGSYPSDIRRWRERIGGLREWPRPRATGRGAYRRRRTFGDRSAVVDRAGADITALVELDTGLLDIPGPRGPRKPIANRTDRPSA